MATCFSMAAGALWVALMTYWRGTPATPLDLVNHAAGFGLGGLLYAGGEWLVRRYRVRIERREVLP